MARKTEEKRRLILYAALEAFEKSGFMAARMEDIAREAGVAKGTIYSYFESKEALLMGLAEEVAPLVLGTMTKLSDRSDMTLKEKILFVAQPLLADNACGRPARIVRVLWSEGLHRPTSIQPILRKLLVPLLKQGGALEQFVADERIPDFYKRYPLGLLAPLVQGVLWQGLFLEDMQLDTEAYFRAYLDFVLPDEAPLKD